MLKNYGLYANHYENVFNYSLESSIFPLSRNESFIIPFHKKRKKSYAANYRDIFKWPAISILPCCQTTYSPPNILNQSYTFNIQKANDWLFGNNFLSLSNDILISDFLCEPGCILKNCTRALWKPLLKLFYFWKLKFFIFPRIRCWQS